MQNDQPLETAGISNCEEPEDRSLEIRYREALSELEAARKAKAELDLLFEDTNAEIAELRIRYDAVTNSRMWRISQPARTLGKSIKATPNALRRRNKAALRQTKAIFKQYRKFGKQSTKISSRALHASLRILKGIVRDRKIDRKLFDPKARRQAKIERSIRAIRRKLRSLGLVEPGLQELKHLTQSASPYRRELAAFEIASWFLDQNDPKDLQDARQYLELAWSLSSQPERRRRIAILSAEAEHRLGDLARAHAVLDACLEDGPHADLYLAKANLASDDAERVDWINKVYALLETAPLAVPNGVGPLYDRLAVTDMASGTGVEADLPLISVIMPVYNSGSMVSTSIDAVLKQTWQNFELIVVDDCSTDDTVGVIESWAEHDGRIRLLKAEENGGPYIARNIGLAAARGEFVTTHDADDWSHPQKLELQARDLLANPQVVANTSRQARADEDLNFVRRGRPGEYVFPNMSSMMFRREMVGDALGYWDRVRFGADAEMIHRIKAVFGEAAFVDLPTAPMSFQRQSRTSLTANDFFGFHGYHMGARLAQFEGYRHFFRSTSEMRYELNPVRRPYPLPEPLRPKREVARGESRFYDVVIASDFRLDGGSTLSSVEEIKAQIAAGKRTGLIQLYRYDYPASKAINGKIRELLESDLVDLLVYGETIECDTMILRYPPVLQHRQRFVPTIKAKTVRIVVNQTPMSDYGESGIRRFHLQDAASNMIAMFGTPGVWHPIGPAVRQALMDHHADELPAIELSDRDWVNIIDTSQWKRPGRRPLGGSPAIGRHARDATVKWPAEVDTLLAVYPASDTYDVRILGGAAIPEEILGEIPANWRVHEFDAISASAFLSDLDVFVYYTHPDWVESFGRVVIEAMATGVPAILPPEYRSLFEDAALYCEPFEVQATVARLMDDPAFYDERVKTALDYVENRFSYAMHIERLNEF